MKVLQINIFGNLSTGRIAVDLYNVLKDNGHDGRVAFARNTIAEGVPYYRIGSIVNVYLDGVLTRLTDRAGFFSRFATAKLIEYIKTYDPDVIHLHNLHGYYINIKLLFDYLKQSGKPVVWTLHDCWAFTGHCCHFSAIGCNKWKTKCLSCPQLSSYPASYFDRSEKNYQEKKSLFTGLSNMHIVAVSKWLENVTHQSFLNAYPIDTIYNGIDLTVFRPIDSDIKQRFNLVNRKVILGVASTWSNNKGLEDFIELNKMITKEYAIVLIGLNDKQIKDMPDDIVCLPRTNGVEELVAWYSAADIYFNASIEETFGLPTVEAMACGTPVIVYDSTALPEVVSEESGIVVSTGDVKQVWNEIKLLASEPIEKDLIRRSALKYDKNIQYRKYLELYERIIKKDDYNGSMYSNKTILAND
ncbi:MAG: glycosyltransferase [Eubacteriales bacterium]|nr:glycosyltransferase [Eubacteriales bacterium]